MPVMDGYSATTHIQKQVQFNDLPIIAMTANAMKGDYEKCMAVGMVDYIIKPVHPGQLYALLYKWLKGKTFNLTKRLQI